MTDPTTGERWLAEAQEGIRRDPGTATRAFALAARKAGRGPVAADVDPLGIVHGHREDVTRASLVVTLIETSSDEAAPLLTEIFQRGDSAERRGVLRGLDAATQTLATIPPAVVSAGVSLLAEALRANEADLVAAAMGPFAAAHLDQHTWRHAVLKLVFMEASLDAVADLDRRRDDELARMAHDFAAERRAAGRPVPPDVDRLTPERSA